MNEPEQQRAVDLDRGLFFVNYKSADDTLAPPRVRVAPARGHEGRMEIILHPDASESTLWVPDSGLVVRVNMPGRLHVEVLPTRAGGSRAAVVRIEPIQSGQAPRISPAINSAPRTESLSSRDGLTVLGHVAGIGDVVVGPNAWIAGPAAPSRIEGLLLEWPDKPFGVDLRYAVQIGNGQSGSGKTMPLGTFAGTRGRALPLTGVVLELAGTDELEFAAEAIFLSAPMLRAVGRRVVLSGPTGREPLVGLRIAVQGVAGTSAALFGRPEETPAVSGKPEPGKPAGSGRVRVFRSRPRQDSSVA